MCGAGAGALERHSTTRRCHSPQRHGSGRESLPSLGLWTQNKVKARLILEHDMLIWGSTRSMVCLRSGEVASELKEQVNRVCRLLKRKEGDYEREHAFHFLTSAQDRVVSRRQVMVERAASFK